ncbi:DUF5340 domain-containing protein [Crocosphaera sp. UHCC 0190]|uniref:DUF5340 domain-containing protein n=1 Tax=Crocosphaera sp. UHCC 0190 TaxID=3110246 RepID=UPI002B221606|nr:DUF5340 domain-containing protein [Crocosphaera sp. UHCC 0190]MEA5508253.1 DUF5340 domain-containing protein [Crocosphaera sp. UHCC 0190]
MKSLPLPSLIHYELLLQLLERKTLAMTYEQPVLQEQVERLIVTLRKARAQQKQLEAICEQSYISLEHHWSLNSIDAPRPPLIEPLANSENLRETT